MVFTDRLQFRIGKGESSQKIHRRKFRLECVPRTDDKRFQQSKREASSPGNFIERHLQFACSLFIDLNSEQYLLGLESRSDIVAFSDQMI